MLYGILVFVFQYSSRRAANTAITRPVFENNLRRLFPQLETLPHADTLFRLLCDIDVSQIEQAHVELLNRLIRNKKFKRYLINNCYPVAIDGSQKISFSILWDEHLLQRKSGGTVDPDSGEEQAYHSMFKFLSIGEGYLRSLFVFQRLCWLHSTQLSAYHMLF